MFIGSATDSDRYRRRTGSADRVRVWKPGSGRLLEEGQEGHHQRRKVQDRGGRQPTGRSRPVAVVALNLLGNGISCSQNSMRLHQL